MIRTSGFIVSRKPPAVPVVPKSFSYAQSRRSDEPPSDEGGGFAVRRRRRERKNRENSLPQSFASQNPAPSSEGAVVQCVKKRICGGGA